MVLREDRDFLKLVQFHEDMIKSMLGQKARGDKNFNEQKESIKEVLEIPSNKFLSWTISLDTFVKTVIDSKINDMELLSQYKKFVEALKNYQAKSMELANQVTEINQDYDLLANIIIKLENKIMILQKTLLEEKEKEKTIEVDTETQEKLAELEDEIQEKNELLQEFEKITLELEEKNKQLEEYEKKLEQLEEQKTDNSQIEELKNKIAEQEEIIETITKRNNNLETQEEKRKKEQEEFYKEIEHKSFIDLNRNNPIPAPKATYAPRYRKMHDFVHKNKLIFNQAILKNYAGMGQFRGDSANADLSDVKKYVAAATEAGDLFEWRNDFDPNDKEASKPSNIQVFFTTNPHIRHPFLDTLKMTSHSKKIADEIILKEKVEQIAKDREEAKKNE